MDNNNEDDVQNLDNEAAEFVTDCLHNPVVLRAILEHFSSKELRQLSFVNKLWKCEARSVMRKRGQFTAYVKSFSPNRCDRFEKFDLFISDVKQMNPVPFSGISMDIRFQRVSSPFSIAALDQLQGFIFDQQYFKTVSAKLQGCWSDHFTSPAVQLIKKVLQDSSGVLEELELFVGSGQENFMDKVVQDFTFPRLKILKLTEEYKSDEAVYENYMKTMLSRAPNLKVFHSSWSVNLMLRVLRGTSIQPVYGSSVHAPFEEISENVLSRIKLESLRLDYTGPEFNIERFNRIAPMLLQQCCVTTISFMHMDAVLAVPLMCYDVRFENLKDLWMGIDFDRLERIEPRILRIAKNFDFTRIFPDVNKVHIAPHYRLPDLAPDHMNSIIERANTVVREPALDRAARVKELVSRSTPSGAAAQFYVDLFPNIEKLEILADGDEQVPFGSIWNWLELKELKVQGFQQPADGNLDSVLLGIFPEEVAELRLKDDEYLKSVNIVPVMPALTCLKNFRALSLIHLSPDSVPYGNDDGTFLFSKVAALVAFARCPALAVSLRVCLYRIKSMPPGPAMTHLKPYVTVEYIDGS